MINDDALVELAKYCAKTCHVLKDATRGKDAGSLSGSSRKAMEDLRTYVDPAQHSISTITNDIRTMHDIESVVSERRNDGLRERHYDSTDEYLIRQRTELQEILRILDVCDCQFTTNLNNTYRGSVLNLRLTRCVVVVFISIPLLTSH